MIFCGGIYAGGGGGDRGGWNKTGGGDEGKGGFHLGAGDLSVKPLASALKPDAEL